METNAVQQEILLVKKSSLCRRQLVQNDANENRQQLPYDEQLEAACWNGWLDAMLPEIINTSATGESLYMWEIMQAKSFLSIELCEHPKAIGLRSSINPYAFLTAVCYE